MEKFKFIDDKFECMGNLVSGNLVDLLHDFLNKLLFVFEKEHRVFKKFMVNVVKIRGEFFWEANVLCDMNYDG